jgi:hypothetical protein
MPKPPPTAKPSICAITGLGDARDAAEEFVGVALVAQAVVAAREGEELRDVGAGDERLAAGAAQHEDAHGVVAVDLVADLAEAAVHVPGHRVARLGTVERQRDDRAIALDDDVLAGRRR